MAKQIAPLIVIVGQTASGKSDLTIQIAQKFNGEIIAADSWTVYKGFDIGTAKPSLADQKLIKHHLIDVAVPKVGFSAAEFKRLATGVIADIQARGKLPILVGGTGLYIDSIIFEYSFLPAGLKGERDELNNLTIDQLLKRIGASGYSLEGIDRRNKRRLIRLIESRGQRPIRHQLRPNTLLIGLKVDKELLKSRITSRVDQMLKNGLEQEVRSLAAKYDWGNEPMKGIGYREFKNYFNGRQDLDETRDQIIRGSLQLAKKQQTWFKRNKFIQWIDDPLQAVQLVAEFLNKK